MTPGREASGTGNRTPGGPGSVGPVDRVALLVPVFARLALAAGFLSAVADRLGLWGPPGADGVAWGAFGPFLDSTATLNPWFPGAWIPAVGILVTAAEVVVGLALAAGWRTRTAGAAAGFLLLSFGVGMSAGTGLKSALDASVFAAAGAGFLLALIGGGPLSVDRAVASDTTPGRGPE